MKYIPMQAAEQYAKGTSASTKKYEHALVNQNDRNKDVVTTTNIAELGRIHFLK